MKKTLVTLLLLSLALAGCIVDSGRGYGDRDRGDRDHSQPHDDHGQRGDRGH